MDFTWLIEYFHPCHLYIIKLKWGRKESPIVTETYWKC